MDAAWENEVRYLMDVQKQILKDFGVDFSYLINAEGNGTRSDDIPEAATGRYFKHQITPIRVHTPSVSFNIKIIKIIHGYSKQNSENVSDEKLTHHSRWAFMNRFPSVLLQE